MTTPAASRPAWGLGLATVADDGTTLDVWYPSPRLGEPPAGDVDIPAELDALTERDDARRVGVSVVRTVIDLDAPPADTADAYLRLHLLSHRLVAPHGVSLDGLFGVLTNVVWTSHGPCAVEGFEATRLRLRADTGRAVTVYGVDKFPRMVDYVVPAGVRIADADRVRLGAHLAAGTTVMHEGFVNFNAGTLGTSMVEGRISQGVVVGDGSDVGGGASTMGTLSGGGTERVVRLPPAPSARARALSLSWRAPLPAPPPSGPGTTVPGVPRAPRMRSASPPPPPTPRRRHVLAARAPSPTRRPRGGGARTPRTPQLPVTAGRGAARRGAA